MAEIVSVLTGSCHCGNCSLVVPTDSVRFGFASCHCSICRKCNAAPFTQWGGMDAAKAVDFQIHTSRGASVQLGDNVATPSGMTSYRSSPGCVRHFCSRCGAHVYIRYDSTAPTDDGTPYAAWAGEVHFPTALLDAESLIRLEEAMHQRGKPRYLHVFYSDRSQSIGDLDLWAAGPKYGGVTGLTPIEYLELCEVRRKYENLAHL